MTSITNAPLSDVEHDAVMTVADAIECVYREDGSRLWRALLAYTGQREIAFLLPGPGCWRIHAERSGTSGDIWLRAG